MINLLKMKSDLEKIANNLKKQGKSDEEIKLYIKQYLNESKRKMNPNGDLDVI